MNNITMKTCYIYTLIISIFLIGSCEFNRTADEWYSSALDSAIKGEFKEAKDRFAKALETDQSYLPAKESLRVVEKAINNRITDNAGVNFFRGISSSNEGKIDTAIIYFSMATNEEQEFSDAYYERALAYIIMGRYDRAINDFTKAIEFNPSDSAAYYNRGLAYAKGKKLYRKAFEDFNSAISINPGLADAYNSRAVAYKTIFNDKKKACADWKKACELGKCERYEIERQNKYCE